MLDIFIKTLKSSPELSAGSKYEVKFKTIALGSDYIASFYHPIGVILIPSKLNVFYTSFVPGIDMISSKHLFFFFSSHYILWRR